SFFFQAEDGIRDDLVTGVQTCALPISVGSPTSPGNSGQGSETYISGIRSSCAEASVSTRCSRAAASAWRPRRRSTPDKLKSTNRSEERRVGKECSARRKTDNETKQETK